MVWMWIGSWADQDARWRWQNCLISKKPLSIGKGEEHGGTRSVFKHHKGKLDAIGRTE